MDNRDALSKSCWRYPMMALFVVVVYWLPAPVVALNSVELRLGRISSQDWEVSDLQLQLSLNPQNPEVFRLSAAQVVHPMLPRPLTALAIRCDQGSISSHAIQCDRGRIQLEMPPFDGGDHAVSFFWLLNERKLSVSFPELRIAGGQLSLEGTWQQGNWQVSGQGSRLDLGQAAAVLSSLGIHSVLELGGMGALVFSISGSGQGIESVDWDVGLQTVSFSTPSGEFLGDTLTATLRGGMSRAEGAFEGWQALRLQQGELLTPWLYLTPGSGLIALDAEFGISADVRTMTVNQLRFRQPEVVDFQVRANLQLAPALDLQSLSLKTRTFDPGKLFTEWLQPVLAAPFFQQLELQGEMQVEMSLSPDPLIKVALNRVSVEQGSGELGPELGLYGLAGELHWPAGPQTPESRLSWRNGRLLGSIGLGPAALELSLQKRGVTVTKPAHLPLLDGALEVERFQMVQTDSGPSVDFQGYLTPISMAQFSEAVGWPPLAGKISGMIPGVQLQQGVLQIDGMMLFRLFGGSILVRRLRLEDLFGALPVFNADIELKDLDLELLTSTFSFGRITGKLEGRVDALWLENWQPVGFDAFFATPQDDDSRHRISQQAVDNISNLGGAGIAGALSRSFLSIFEEFGYHRLGISCRLENEVCHMGGIAQAPNGYYLVKGGGIPRIDIIGYNQRTDWTVLMEKLQQIVSGGTPVVQ